VPPPPGIPPPPPLPIPPAPVRPPPPAPPPPPAHVATISNADFLRQPNNDDMQEYYPDRALRMNAGGKATVRCTVTKSGALTGCSILSEDPPDFGFGQATLSVTHIWKIRPKSVDGAPTEGGTFQRTVVWRPPPPD
jgi:protein TonB